MVKRWLVRLLLLCVACALLSVAGLAALFWVHSRDLPSLEPLLTYDPPQVSRVLAQDGSVVGEYFTERRTVIPRESMPRTLLDAVVAAEDASFYQHEGLNFFRLMTALVRNVLSMRITQGGSTISQQVIKNVLLVDEARVSRKAKEMILVWKVEQELTKDEILSIYLNQIYYGNGCYGVAEAAYYYFGKAVHELSLAQLAYLAGAPQRPNAHALNRHPQQAKKRQQYVLRRMMEEQFITQKQWEKADAAPLSYTPPKNRRLNAPYVTAHIRDLVKPLAGPDASLQDGLVIQTGIDPFLQDAANEAMRNGLLALNRHFGYAPLHLYLNQSAREVWKRKIKRARELRPFDTEKLFAFSAETEAAQGKEVWETKPVPLDHGRIGLAFVTAIDDENGTVTVDLGERAGVLSWKDMGWLRPWGPAKKTKPYSKPSEAFTLHNVVMVRLPDGVEDSRTVKEDNPVRLVVEQPPAVQGALVALDVDSHEIRALVGGANYDLSTFNRAILAKRQPGSSFKPITYLTALAQGKATAATLLDDSPVVYWNGNNPWKPRNYDGKFRGLVRLRTALALSLNIPVIRMMQELTPQAVIEQARSLGIESSLTANLTLALGSGEVTVMEMARAYAVMASGGLDKAPVWVTSIKQTTGKVLFRDEVKPKRVLDENLAYIMTNLMQSVVEQGTGRAAARKLKRPLAGKTGTSSKYKDGWFVGYSPRLLCAVWVGFDEGLSMGHLSSTKTALPIWIDFMAQALRDQPVEDFTPTKGVSFQAIDRDTGVSSNFLDPKAIREVFLDGTGPNIAFLKKEESKTDAASEGEPNGETRTPTQDNTEPPTPNDAPPQPDDQAPQEESR